METAYENGLTFADLQARTGWRKEVLELVIKKNIEKKAIIKADNFYIARTPFDGLIQKILDVIEAHHKKEPLSEGILRETLRERIGSHIPIDIFRSALMFLEDKKKIFAEKDTVKDSSHNQELSTEERRLKSVY